MCTRWLLGQPAGPRNSQQQATSESTKGRTPGICSPTTTVRTIVITEQQKNMSMSRPYGGDDVAAVDTTVEAVVDGCLEVHGAALDSNGVDV